MSAMGVSVWTHGLILAVLCVVATRMEGTAMIRTTAALLANWAVHMLHWGITRDPSPYFFSIVIDAITSVIILTRPAGRLQATIGWLLLVQIMVGFGYALSVRTGGYVAQAEYRYWQILDGVALVQILLVGGWWIGGMGRRLLGHHPDTGRSGDRSSVVPDDRAGVARP